MKKLSSHFMFALCGFMEWCLGEETTLLLLDINLMDTNIIAEASFFHFITGRLMVGLRWWNHVDDNGVSHWVFEARKVGVIVYCI